MYMATWWVSQGVEIHGTYDHDPNGEREHHNCMGWQEVAVGHSANLARAISVTMFTGNIAIRLANEVIDPATPTIQRPYEGPYRSLDYAACISEHQRIQ